MSIFSETIIKSKFPRWENFCTLQGDSISAAERFTLAYEDGLAIMGFYVSLTDDTATDQLNLCFKDIVAGLCFEFKHGDKNWPEDERPQLLKNKDAAIDKLILYQNGKMPNAEEPGANADTIRMTAKTRKFGTWFTDAADDLTSSE